MCVCVVNALRILRAVRIEKREREREDLMANYREKRREDEKLMNEARQGHDAWTQQQRRQLQLGDDPT